MKTYSLLLTITLSSFAFPFSECSAINTATESTITKRALTGVSDVLKSVTKNVWGATKVITKTTLGTVLLGVSAFCAVQGYSEFSKVHSSAIGNFKKIISTNNNDEFRKNGTIALYGAGSAVSAILGTGLLISAFSSDKKPNTIIIHENHKSGNTNSNS